MNWEHQGPRSTEFKGGHHTAGFKGHMVKWNKNELSCAQQTWTGGDQNWSEGQKNFSCYFFHNCTCQRWLWMHNWRTWYTPVKNMDSEMTVHARNFWMKLPKLLKRPPLQTQRHTKMFHQWTEVQQTWLSNFPRINKIMTMIHWTWEKWVLHWKPCGCGYVTTPTLVQWLLLIFLLLFSPSNQC